MISRSLDWLSFWLKGEIDSDPSKKEQYRRWLPRRDAQRKIIQASLGGAESLPPFLN